MKNPPIMILDEATSALDNESEKIVQASLEKLAKGRTTITIAHRLTTIKNASVILVLTHNGIEEKGTHQELMEKRGIYYHLTAATPMTRPCRRKAKLEDLRRGTYEQRAIFYQHPRQDRHLLRPWAAATCPSSACSREGRPGFRPG